MYPLPHFINRSCFFLLFFCCPITHEDSRECRQQMRRSGRFLFRRCVSVASAALRISAEEVCDGPRFSPGWALYFKDCKGHKISPWCDVPLGEGDVIAAIHHGESPSFHFVCEIPRGTREKLEVATKKEFNPIQQDIVKKTGALRCFTYGDIPFNYGCLPQTWEDPELADPHTGLKGDGDPVDVVELSDAPCPTGQISAVRVIGALGLIDEGEMDWKMLAVPVSSREKTVQDIPSSVLDGIRHWFRYYKTTDGKKENAFAEGGRFLPAKEALPVISRLHSQYKALLAKPKCHLWVAPPS